MTIAPQPQATPAVVFTERELEVLDLAVTGLRDKEIADRLRISTSTVNTFIRQIYTKTQVDGRVRLLLWAQRNGLA